MPKRLDKILSFYRPRGCWRKRYKGQTYYLTGHEGKDHGFEGALLEWLQLKARIDAGEPCTRFGVIPDEGPILSVQSIARLTKHAVAISNWTGRAVLAAESERPQAATIEHAVAEYLKEQKQRLKREEIGLASFKDYGHKLEDFKGFCISCVPPRTLCSQIDVTVLRSYRTATLDLPPLSLPDGSDGPPISKATARKRLLYVKGFVEWCYRQGFLDTLPRNLDKTFARVGLGDPTPHPLKKEEVQPCFAAALTMGRRGRAMALYILLGVNCGYRSGDIASLRHEQVDWTRGIIIRARKKTGSPQVHKLWPVTLKLLKEQASNASDSPLVLLDALGGELVKETELSKHDCITRQFARLRSQMGWTERHKTHAALRDTGATWLKENFPTTPILASQYLGHKVQGVIAHYTPKAFDADSPHYKPLFDALDAMGVHFALTLPADISTGQ